MVDKDSIKTEKMESRGVPDTNKEPIKKWILDGIFTNNKPPKKATLDGEM